MRKHYTSELVRGLFGSFRGYLQADASNVYDILERGVPKDNEDGVRLVGCFAHCRIYFFEAAICRYRGALGSTRAPSAGTADFLRIRSPVVMLRDRFPRFSVLMRG